MADKQTSETNAQKYKFVIKLKKGEEYTDKQGNLKTFDKFFIQSYEQSEVLKNAIEFITEDSTGKKKKILLSKDQIATIEENI